MIDVTDASQCQYGPRIHFLQHRGCLDPTNNRTRQNTPAAAKEVLDRYSNENCFAGLEMDVSYSEVPIAVFGDKVQLQLGWIAAHDIPKAGDATPWTFESYLQLVVPLLLEYGKRLNVEVKGTVDDAAVEKLAKLVEESFSNANGCSGDPKEYVIFTSFRASNLVFLGERGYQVGVFVHRLRECDGTAVKASIEQGFSWAEMLRMRRREEGKERRSDKLCPGAANSAGSLRLFLILRLHASVQVEEQLIREWEERALKMDGDVRLQLWYTGVSAEDAWNLAGLKHRLNLTLAQRGAACGALPALAARSARDCPPTRLVAGEEESEPLMVLIDDDIKLLPDRAKYLQLYGRHSGVAWLAPQS